jgi:hypothetical protein
MYQPHIIACSVIFLTARMMSIRMPTEPPWFEIFDAELRDLLLISELIMDIYGLKVPRGVPLKPFSYTSVSGQ